MKKTLLTILLFALYISTPAIVFAYDGWSTGLITSIRYQSTKTLITQVGMSNPAGCSYTTYLYLEEDDSNFAKRANAAISIAIAAGKEVSFALTGCSEGGTAGYPIITEVWLKD